MPIAICFLAFTNVIFMLIMLYFLSRVSWSKPSDRPSVIGFIAMAATFAVDAAWLILGVL